MSEKRDDAKMPPIPDGGLAESMPDWLRRPPAWRTLQDEEVVQTKPVETGQLPEPDTSVIDPRAFLTDDDLPSWLRNLRRVGRSSTADAGGGEAAATTSEEERAGTTRLEAAEAGREPVSPAQIKSTSRFIPRNPQVAGNRPPERSAPTPPAPSGERQPITSPWWQGTAVVLFLTALLLAATVVIVILAVA